MSNDSDPIVEAYNINLNLLKEFGDLKEFLEDVQEFESKLTGEIHEVMGDFEQAHEIFSSAKEGEKIVVERLNKDKLRDLMKDEEDARETIIEMIELINSIEEESENVKQILKNMENYMERLEQDISPNL